MDNRQKRLAAAKKKLQEYKNQKSKHDNPEGTAVTKLDFSAQDEPGDTDSGTTESFEIQNSSFETSVHSDDISISLETQPGTSSVTTDLAVNQGDTNATSCEEDAVNVGRTKPEEAIDVSGTISPIASVVSCVPPAVNVEAASPVLSFSEDKETQYDNEEDSSDELMKESLQDLQNELSKVRSENSRLFQREVELVQQLETSEKIIRDLRKEVNQFKEKATQLHQLEDMQQAVGVLSKAKVALAEQLSNEQDNTIRLEEIIEESHRSLEALDAENEGLILELNNAKAKLEELNAHNKHLEEHKQGLSLRVQDLEKKLKQPQHDIESKFIAPPQYPTEPPVAKSTEEAKEGAEYCSTVICASKDHNHQVNGLNHSHDTEEGHSHDHNSVHDDDHTHHEHSSIGEETQHEHTPKGPMDKIVEMNKTLKRLEWQNTTYEEELKKLSSLKEIEPRARELESKNIALQQQVDRLEHLVIQLQGENDTIGDYIALYQTQKLALREHAKENEILVETLSRERNELLQKLSELSSAVEKLAETKTQENGEVGLESEIRNLIHNVTTKVHEPYSCSTCSGSRMMTV